MTNVASKVKECKAFLDEATKTYSLQFRLLHKFQCFRKIPGEDTRVSSIGFTFSMPYKVFLATCDDMLPEKVRLMNLTAPELAEVLQAAAIDVDFEDFAAGDKYTDANGTEQTHNHAGTTKTINALQLSEVSISNVESTRKAAKAAEEKKLAEKNKFTAFFEVVTAQGINAENMHITL